MVMLPNSGGGGGGGGIGGGGKPPSGGGTPASFVPFLENGGFAATSYFLFVPTQSSAGGNAYIGVFASSNYNDIVDGSSYSWRMEEIDIALYPTVHRVILTYRDLGVVKAAVTVKATNDNDQVIGQTVPVTLGTPQATGAILTEFVDLLVSGFRPQLSIDRAAGAGPLSIIAATMVGETEEVMF